MLLLLSMTTGGHQTIYPKLQTAVRGMHQVVVIRSTISSRLFFKPDAKPNSAGRDAPKVLKSSHCAILRRPLLSGSKTLVVGY